MALGGHDLFVVNNGSVVGGSVIELNASTGAPVRVFSGPEYTFNAPDPIAASGHRPFVANQGGDSVTELVS
jgi:hypothetical protein